MIWLLPYLGILLESLKEICLQKKKKKQPTISEASLGVQSLQGSANYGT